MKRHPRTLSLEPVKRELKQLRQGEGLARPSAVLRSSLSLREHLAGGPEDMGDSAEAIITSVAAIRRAVDGLGRNERFYAEVDFNLTPEHSYPTLTERQESLARQLKCAGKTVRRRADRALDTLALVLVTGEDSPAAAHATHPPATATERVPQTSLQRQDELRRFWRLSEHSRADICALRSPKTNAPTSLRRAIGTTCGTQSSPIWTASSTSRRTSYSCCPR